MSARPLLAALALISSTLGLASYAAPPASKAIDPSALGVRASFPGPDGGWDFTTFDPVHRRVYISRSTGVTALDVDTGTVTPQLVKGSVTHIALPINKGEEILVTNGGTAGAFIANALTGEVRVANIPTGKRPDGALLEPSTGLAWVLDNGGGGIALIDPKAGAVVGKIDVEGALESSATDGSGKVFITVEDKTEIVVIDAKKRVVTSRIKLEGCEEPGGLALAPELHRLVVSCANGVSKIVDANKGAIIASLPIGPRPDVAIYDPARKLVFIPTGGDGKMTAVDPDKLTVAGVVQSATGARSGAVDPKTDRIYLPSGKFADPATPGGRPTLVPGSFAIIAVGAP